MIALPLSANASALVDCINSHIKDRSFRQTAIAAIASRSQEEKQMLNALLDSLTDPKRKDLLERTILNTPAEVMSSYLRGQSEGKWSSEELLSVILSADFKASLPGFSKPIYYEYFMKAMLGEEDKTVQAWAKLGEADLKRSHPDLADRLAAYSSAQQDEIKLTKDSSETVSLLWYPKYPGNLPVSNTHTKIIVDDQVWSTMRKYSLKGSRKAHERLARRSVKDSFFEFRIRTTPEEVERLKLLLENNDRRGTGIGMCVQGACGALSQAGVLRVPPPFNQLPSLAALYLSAARVVAPSKLSEVRFVGKSVGRSLLSIDLVADGVAIQSVLFYGVATAAVLGVPGFKIERRHKPTPVATPDPSVVPSPTPKN